MARLEALANITYDYVAQPLIWLSPAIAVGGFQAARGEKVETVLVSAVAAEIISAAVVVLGATRFSLPNHGIESGKKSATMNWHG